MRRLYILRHGEAASTQTRDFDRPLTPRGIAYISGLRSRVPGFTADLVLCSPARRTWETAQLFLSDAIDAAIIKFEDKIYDAPPGLLLQKLQALEPANQNVLLVGHNPGVHGLAMTLTGSGEKEAQHKLQLTFNPGSLAVFDFECTWPDLAPGCGHLTAFYPS